MTKDEAKAALLDKIVGLQGIKVTQLASEPEIVMGLQGFDIPDLLDEMVQEGKIMEIEYVLPDMQWRCKSFYLPVGTKVRVIENK